MVPSFLWDAESLTVFTVAGLIHYVHVAGHAVVHSGSFLFKGLRWCSSKYVLNPARTEQRLTVFRSRVYVSSASGGI